MNPRKRTARLAGLLLLLGGITTPFSLIYLPKRLIVAGDATATANNVRAFENVLRIAIACDLVGAILFTLAGLSLYRLFKDVDNRQALYMIVLWVVTVPITFINELNRIGALILVSGAGLTGVAADSPPLASLGSLATLARLAAERPAVGRLPMKAATRRVSGLLVLLLLASLLSAWPILLPRHGDAVSLELARVWNYRVKATLFARRGSFRGRYACSSGSIPLAPSVLAARVRLGT